LQSEPTLTQQFDGTSVLELYQEEFTQQPYCGFYLSYLLFHEFSDNATLVRKALTNITPFDYLVQIALIEKAHGLQINDDSFDDQESQVMQDAQFDLDRYFNANRRLKLQDKIEDESVFELCSEFIEKMIELN